MHILHHFFFISSESCLLISMLCITPVLLNEVELTVEFRTVQAKVPSIFVE